MLRRVLVANRGEIACRIFRTCRELGIATAAVYSDADAQALHVREADTAVRLAGSAPGETYLRGDLLVRAALAAGADAVHPGYGFLSENAEFARAVLDAGLVWIGPPPAAIEAMAYKTDAKRIMRDAGLTLFDALDPEAVTAGDLPVLVKASAGGGGRGMRVVRELDALPGELKAASAEAESAFGDGRVFVEPYVERGRHVEVQILADGQGGVWTLGTRDCSLQRRHQKVVEEAPAPGLGEALEREMERAAVAAAKAIDYAGAGTVEFLVADGRAYFLEMNTRLQVEHPVTEAVFDIDLVAWQLRVAEGARLPEAPPAPSGRHAIEARLYAEDPARGWAPQAGVLHRFDVPLDGDGIRVDSGYAGGDEIGVHYDPMLAKVVAHGATRAEAARRLAGALERTRIHGPVTNRELLVRSLRHPEFLAGEVHTGFYDRHLDGLTARADDDGMDRCAALAAALADGQGRSRLGVGGWRNLPSALQTKSYRSEPDGAEFEVGYRITRDGIEGHPGVRLVGSEAGRTVLEVDGVRHEFHVVRHGGEERGRGPDRVFVDSSTRAWTFVALPRFADPVEQRAPGSLLAPMPGTVVRVADGLAAGDAVRAGTPLLWLEAMKMEHRIVAPVTGTLTALHAAPGRQVEVGTLLAVVEPDGVSVPGGTAADVSVPDGTAADAPNAATDAAPTDAQEDPV
ncbi:ATP-grasp domain-containing protein [Streptomyces triticagri]|uniref:ATP-grasp domain-containing protein n=1 Tax=Streptomyces triticagri TaxID=2293568 RepID=A0A372M5Z0_9ACTN|nr:biotin carboxylase N-terminal domain-containing protein [Streptomyces triticagri]RFU86358.1 ATP-grasp domain-containing protein [Streptomyces triticagri]